MHEARVLVIDDSAAMRALFCDILDEAKNVRVVGTAASADEARDMIEELHPNVLTLDVEMPGTSGMEFLEEIMEESPMAVVMLSSLTQVGTGTALKALELGAVECFPKPIHTSHDEFKATVGKLGKIVLAAANSNVRGRIAEGAPPSKAPSGDGFAWNGNVAVLAGSMGSVETLKGILAAYPANCPPTVAVLSVEPGIVKSFIDKTCSSFACKVNTARDGSPLIPGQVYIAYEPETHAIIEQGDPPRLRLVEKPPIAGVRPSADLLFGSLARSKVASVAALLSGYGTDGVKGLAMLRAAGTTTLVQDPSTATISETPQLAITAGGASEILATNPLQARMLELCSRLEAAAQTQPETETEAI